MVLHRITYHRCLLIFSSTALIEVSLRRPAFGQFDRSVPGLRKRQKRMVVTGLGDEDISIRVGGATFNKDPQANRPRHKEQGGRR
ncbi:hypothetical protein BGY98DRAFT_991119 [Russula aff. rugulosa BPL654]|nr:hypothetical protein BGY98DRAFT_991119 [Russula aff. rugulosa BPL654]